MPRNVNVTHTGWQPLGSTAQCPQYRMTLRFDWIDDTGQPQTWGPTQVTFPNFLSQLTAPELAYFAEELQELLVKIARRRAGVDG